MAAYVEAEFSGVGLISILTPIGEIERAVKSSLTAQGYGYRTVSFHRRGDGDTLVSFYITINMTCDQTLWGSDLNWLAALVQRVIQGVGFYDGTVEVTGQRQLTACPTVPSLGGGTPTPTGGGNNPSVPLPPGAKKDFLQDFADSLKISVTTATLLLIVGLVVLTRK